MLASMSMTERPVPPRPAKRRAAPPRRRWRTACGLLTAMLMAATGCHNSENSSDASAGRVAIIDLDRVFTSLGRQSELRTTIEGKQETLNQRVRALQTKLQDQYQAKAKEFGDEPTEDQARQLQRLDAELTAQLERERAKAREEFEQFRQDHIVRFREEVKPVAREAAAAKGLSVVLTKAENVYVFPPEADITDDVIARMARSGDRGAKKE